MSQTHTVICTAGHIDHGKSSLIEALTGQHPDVLQEEQEREMTIELGFVFYGDDVTFIDVPGHEKFLKTMLAGASGVDGAVLVIAADDGVMPQTREHFEILQLMGIQAGVVALTKIDIVDPDWVDLVKEEISDLCKGTFLEGAPIIPLSNRTGQGIDTFRQHLDELIQRTPSRKERGLFRMWLDRAFTIKGSGTVVAGTVLSGSLKPGERVEILPAGTIARVKRIQVHKKDVPSCRIGERAAINLPGIDKEQVNRGDLMATPEHYRPAYMLNAQFLHLSSDPRPLENRVRVRLHLGSSEILGRVVLLEGNPIAPGERAYIQFRLENQAMADVGDRYVIRSFSEGRVLGGGVILETHPQKTSIATRDELKRLRRLESAEPREIVRQYLNRIDIGMADAETIAHQTAFLVSDIVDILAAMRRDNVVTVIEPHPRWGVVLTTRYREWRSNIVRFLDEFHKQKPNMQGARRADIKSRLMPRVAPAILEELLKNLVSDEQIIVSGELVRRSGFEIAFSESQDEIRTKLDQVFSASLFTPPTPEEAFVDIKADKKEIQRVFTGMIELGVILKLHTPEGKPLYFHKKAIETSKQLLLKFFEDHQEMKFFEFRELINSTRKFTTPLLMYFDDNGLTMRDGDVRILRNR